MASPATRAKMVTVPLASVIAVLLRGVADTVRIVRAQTVYPEFITFYQSPRIAPRYGLDTFVASIVHAPLTIFAQRKAIL